jgi:hypothetical protein
MTPDATREHICEFTTQQNGVRVRSVDTPHAIIRSWMREFRPPQRDHHHCRFLGRVQSCGQWNGPDQKPLMGCDAGHSRCDGLPPPNLHDWGNGSAPPTAGAGGLARGAIGGKGLG